MSRRHRALIGTRISSCPALRISPSTTASTILKPCMRLCSRMRTGSCRRDGRGAVGMCLCVFVSVRVLWLGLEFCCWGGDLFLFFIAWCFLLLLCLCRCTMLLARFLRNHTFTTTAILEILCIHMMVMMMIYGLAQVPVPERGQHGGGEIRIRAAPCAREPRT